MKLIQYIKRKLQIRKAWKTTDVDIASDIITTRDNIIAHRGYIDYIDITVELRTDDK